MKCKIKVLLKPAALTGFLNAENLVGQNVGVGHFSRHDLPKLEVAGSSTVTRSIHVWLCFRVRL